MLENHEIVFSNVKFYHQSPAPWELHGEGIILVYKFPKEWVENHGQLPNYLKGKFKGGLGYVMLVNYEKSPVGPYHELLIIPGKFRKSRKQAITKIYVDSEASTQNGRANWGIPKETLPFVWEKNGEEDLIRIKDGNKIVFACDVKAWGIPFPTSTSFLPINLEQTWNKIHFLTQPTGSGRAKLAKIKNLKVDPDYFPDISKLKPLFAVKIKPFHITFPAPLYGDK
jgi:hypothetical protein